MANVVQDVCSKKWNGNVSKSVQKMTGFAKAWARVRSPGHFLKHAPHRSRTMHLPPRVPAQPRCFCPKQHTAALNITVHSCWYRKPDLLGLSARVCCQNETFCSSDPLLHTSVPYNGPSSATDPRWLCTALSLPSWLNVRTQNERSHAHRACVCVCAGHGGDVGAVHQQHLRRRQGPGLCLRLRFRKRV